MNPRTRSLFAAGPIALIGAALIVLAGLVLPFIGVIFLLALFAHASKPQPPGTLSPFITVIPLLAAPAQTAYLGAVMLAAANRRVSAGSRVANGTMVGLSIAILAISVAGLLVLPRFNGWSIYAAAVGVLLPLVVVTLRFTERPSVADTI
ncbi:MAG: hypothetical protein HEQ23_10215 [Tepidisphaera sp.]